MYIYHNVHSLRPQEYGSVPLPLMAQCSKNVKMEVDVTYHVLYLNVLCTNSSAEKVLPI